MSDSARDIAFGWLMHTIERSHLESEIERAERAGQHEIADQLRAWVHLTPEPKS